MGTVRRLWQNDLQRRDLPLYGQLCTDVVLSNHSADEDESRGREEKYRSEIDDHNQPTRNADCGADYHGHPTRKSHVQRAYVLREPLYHSSGRRFVEKAEGRSQDAVSKLSVYGVSGLERAVDPSQLVYAVRRHRQED